MNQLNQLNQLKQLKQLCHFIDFMDFMDWLAEFYEIMASWRFVVDFVVDFDDGICPSSALVWELAGIYGCSSPTKMMVHV